MFLFLVKCTKLLYKLVKSLFIMRILLILIFLFLSSCKFERLVDNHGTHYLEKKQKKLTINVTNKNDIINILGPPSTKDKFDNDVWLYIERKKTNQGVLALGRKKTYLNNVLLLEINNKGLLEEALTHSSFKNKSNSNQERLEFLGDRVLGLVIADFLFKNFLKERDGVLTNKFRY